MKEIRDGTRNTNSHWKPLSDAKPIICIDFDHTISRKCLACEGGLVGDGLQQGAKEAIQELSKYFRIWIYSGNPKHTKHSSSQQRDIRPFLVKYQIPYEKILQTKPLACFIIDDRAIHHTSWKRTMSEVRKRARGCIPLES